MGLRGPHCSSGCRWQQPRCRNVCSTWRAWWRTDVCPRSAHAFLLFWRLAAVAHPCASGSRRRCWRGRQINTCSAPCRARASRERGLCDVRQCGVVRCKRCRSCRGGRRQQGSALSFCLSSCAHGPRLRCRSGGRVQAGVLPRVAARAFVKPLVHRFAPVCRGPAGTAPQCKDPGIRQRRATTHPSKTALHSTSGGGGCGLCYAAVHCTSRCHLCASTGPRVPRSRLVFKSSATRYAELLQTGSPMSHAIALWTCTWEHAPVMYTAQRQLSASTRHLLSQQCD